VNAQETLTEALSALADRRVRTPCQRSGSTRDYWTSDVREEREYATAACRLCPVHAQCRAAAEETDERHGVWAGVDRTRPTNRNHGSTTEEREKEDDE